MTIYIDKTQKQCYSRRIRYDNRLTHKKGEQNEEKTAAMVLAALMAFSMTACGNGSTQKEDDSTAADQETTEATETADNTAADDTASGDETVELHWLNKCESDSEAQIWQQVADLVHEKYPNITVTIENTNWTSYWTKLPVELASGNAPDLIYMHFSRASDYTNSMLPISDYIEKDEDVNIDDFYSGILDSFIFDDQVYALPYDFGPYIMYYNKDLFDKYGVEYPDENTTWEEFKDKCKQLTQDGNYGTVFASSLDYYDPQVLSLGGEIINEKGEFDITGDKTTAALQSLADLINVDKVAPKIADTANTVWNWEQFEGGNIGMMIDGPWGATNVTNYCDFNVGYSIIPKAEKQVTTINGSALAVTSESKHPKEAYQALEVLTSPEAQKLLAENGRALPSRDSVRESYYESTSELEGLEDAIKKSIEIGMPYYVTKKYSEVSTVFNSGMDTVWAGEVSAKDAAKDIQAQVDMILQ